MGKSGGGRRLLLSSAIVVALLAVLLSSCSPVAGQSGGGPVSARGAAVSQAGMSGPFASYRFATADEGKDLLLANDGYSSHFTQNDLDMRLQKQGATLQEWESFAADQVRDFTDGEEEAIASGMAELASLAAQRGLELPPVGEIAFVKTTMHEECDAVAYTHGAEIYVGDILLHDLQSEDEETRTDGLCVLAHEVFHCITRANPGFRAEMYGIIGFNVQADDYAFGPNVTERLISNSDVEHHDSSALFTIGGRQRRCALVFYADAPFREKGDDIYSLGKAGLVPVDDPNTIIPTDQADDFYDVVGRNTDYVVDPEEVMADNFSFALVHGPDPAQYANPEIIAAILSAS